MKMNHEDVGGEIINMQMPVYTIKITLIAKLTRQVPGVEKRGQVGVGRNINEMANCIYTGRVLLEPRHRRQGIFHDSTLQTSKGSRGPSIFIKPSPLDPQNGVNAQIKDGINRASR